MTDQWQELKETIIELRDSNGTGTQQEVCKFLVNYMGILEKQMQEPCEDAISRQEAVEAFQMFREYESNRSNKGWVDRIETVLNQLPPGNPQPKTGYWIRTGNYLTTAYSSIEYVKCSCCHEDSLEEGDYCPNCGAIMSEIPTGSESEEV